MQCQCAHGVLALKVKIAPLQDLHSELPLWALKSGAACAGVRPPEPTFSAVWRGEGRAQAEG